MVQLISDGRKLVIRSGHFVALGVELAFRVVIVGFVVVVMALCLLVAVLRWKLTSFHRPLSCGAPVKPRKIRTRTDAG